MKIDTEAIAHRLNQSLTFDGIIAKVSVKNDCLKIALDSVAVTKKDQLLPIIMREIANFKLTSIKTVKIYGKQIKTFDPNWYHNFDLQPENNYECSQSNKSKNYKNTSNYEVKIPKRKVSQAEFEEELKKCSKMANSAYDISIRYAKKIEIVITQLNSDIEAVSHEILKFKGSEQLKVTETLKQIQFDVKNISEDSLEDLVISLDKKRKHLKDFTVALFGRTKAGKSTLRETLTRGNGSTIGKGSQRTTRDIKEYFWQGLRLLDTPGIEAYQGNDDTNKANDIIDQSDIVLFLTSDDSVQPGEFQAMAQLQQINKYFAVILNVKHDIANNLEDLQMFIDIPEMVFDEDRLSQHKNHIQNHIQEYLNLHNVDIVPIHAQSGFLSTKSEYQEYSRQLWELSKIEELYSLIAYQIYNNGQKLRLATFADSLDNLLGEIYQKLIDYKQELEEGREFLNNKKKDLEKIFLETETEGLKTIKSKSNELFSQIDEKINSFVERYKETNLEERKKEWKNIVNQKNIEINMKDIIEKIFKELDEKLKEFQREYEYDFNNIKIDMENVKIRDFRKGKSASDMNWTSVGIGAVGAAAFVAANWWNPGGWVVAAGWIATGIGIATKVAAEWINSEEEKTHKKNVQEEKDSLRKQVYEQKQATIKSCEDCLYTNINKLKHQLIYPCELYDKKLVEIIKNLDKTIAEILNIKQEVKTDF